MIDVIQHVTWRQSTQHPELEAFEKKIYTYSAIIKAEEKYPPRSKEGFSVKEEDDWRDKRQVHIVFAWGHTPSGPTPDSESISLIHDKRPLSSLPTRRYVT